MKMFSFQMTRNDKLVRSGFIIARDEDGAKQVASKIAKGIKPASRPDQVLVRESTLDDVRAVVLDAPHTQTYAENLYEVALLLAARASSVALCEERIVEVLNRYLIHAKQDSERYRKLLSVMEPIDFGDGCTDEACAMYMRHMRFDALARSADQAITQLSAAINRLTGSQEEEVLLTACD